MKRLCIIGLDARLVQPGLHGGVGFAQLAVVAGHLIEHMAGAPGACRNRLA